MEKIYTIVDFEKKIWCCSIVSVLFYKENDTDCTNVFNFLSLLMNENEFKTIKYFKFDIECVDAKDNPDFIKAYELHSSPIIIIYRYGLEVCRILSPNNELIKVNLKKILDYDSSVKRRLILLTNQEPIMVFILGDADATRNVFSRKMIDLLNDKKVKFGTFNVLNEKEICLSLKVFSKCTTIPQLYVKGKFIGDLNVVEELNKNGELDKILKDFIP